VVGANGGIYWTAIPHSEILKVTRNDKLDGIEGRNDESGRMYREIYGGCGKTKGCFGTPSKCVENYNETSDNPQVCDMIVTWERIGEKNRFQLSGKLGTGTRGYVALGMSKDELMGEDSVVGCGTDGHTVTLKRYHNPGYYNQIHSDSSLGLVQLPMNLNVDGQLYCRFEQTDHALENFAINFDSSPYYYFLARANEFNGNTGLRKHEYINDRVSSPKPIHVNDLIIL